jgi:hypothetical protein
MPKFLREDFRISASVILVRRVLKCDMVSILHLMMRYTTVD